MPRKLKLLWSCVFALSRSRSLSLALARSRSRSLSLALARSRARARALSLSLSVQQYIYKPQKTTEDQKKGPAVVNNPKPRP